MFESGTLALKRRYPNTYSVYLFEKLDEIISNNVICYQNTQITTRLGS